MAAAEEHRWRISTAIMNMLAQDTLYWQYRMNIPLCESACIVCVQASDGDSQDSCSADDVAAAAPADYTSQHIRTASQVALDQSRCPVNCLHHNLVLCLRRPACEQDP